METTTLVPTGDHNGQSVDWPPAWAEDIGIAMNGWDGSTFRGGRSGGHRTGDNRPSTDDELLNDEDEEGLMGDAEGERWVQMQRRTYSGDPGEAEPDDSGGRAGGDASQLARNCHSAVVMLLSLPENAT